MIRLLTIFLFCFVSGSYGQLEISTGNLEEAAWNNKTAAWDIYFTEEKTTFFEFSKELTELKQVSISETVRYCILKWDYDEKELKYTMSLVSDAGENFELIIDGANNQMLLFFWKKGKYLMLRHEIKTSDFKK